MEVGNSPGPNQQNKKAHPPREHKITYIPGQPQERKLASKDNSDKIS